MTSLKAGMGLQDVVALGISAAVGVSIFSVVSPATSLAGPGVLIALCLATIPMTVFAVLYAFLSSADPRTGASYHWPADYVHPYAGFIICWLRILGSAGALNIMATIFADYFGQMVTIPSRITVVGLLTLFFCINLIGVRAAGAMARLLTAIKLIVLVSFIAIGLFYVRFSQFVPVAPNGAFGILAALPLLVGLFSGIESATEAGEEVRNSRRAIGLGLAIATAISVCVYVGVTIVCIGVLGPAQTAASRAPLADAAGILGGAWTSPVLVVTALISIAAAINAQFLMFARFLFAMGRDGALNPIFGRVDQRWGTPAIATTAVYVATLLSLAMPDNLLFLFLAVNIPTILKYAANCISATGLVARRPDLHRAAAFQLRRETVRGWAWVGLVSAAILFIAGLQADWRPYALLLGWGALGTAYWFAVSRSRCESYKAGADVNIDVVDP